MKHLSKIFIAIPLAIALQSCQTPSGGQPIGFNHNHQTNAGSRVRVEYMPSPRFRPAFIELADSVPLQDKSMETSSSASGSVSVDSINSGDQELFPLGELSGEIEILTPDIAKEASVQVAEAPKPSKYDLRREDMIGESVYIVKKGDTLWSISRRCNSTVKDLCIINKIKASRPLHIGQKLAITSSVALLSGEDTRPSLSPGKKKKVKLVKAVKKSNKKKYQPIKGSTYKVGRGDSLWVIARRCGSTVKKLRSLNNLKSDKIIIGQELILVSSGKKSAGKPSEPDVVKAKTLLGIEKLVPPVSFTEELDSNFQKPEKAGVEFFTYDASAGETLEQIASSFEIDLGDLEKFNKGFVPALKGAAPKTVKVPLVDLPKI